MREREREIEPFIGALVGSRETLPITTLKVRDPEFDSTDILSAILESQRGIDIALFVVNGVVLMTVPTGSQRACHNNLGDATCRAAPQYMYRIP